jgi:hypothetical protein
LSLIKWRAFEKVTVGKTKDGEIKEVVRLETKLTSLREFMLFAAPKIRKFVMQNFVAQWQDAYFLLSKKKLEPNEILSLIDFAKNYFFKHHNEI